MSHQNNGHRGRPLDDRATAQGSQHDETTGHEQELKREDHAMAASPEKDDAVHDNDPGADSETITRAVHEAVLEAETAELKEKLLRAVAETDNIRKRMEREVAQARKFAVSEFVKDIIPLTDTFQRAIEAVPNESADNDPALKSLLDGVILTERQFLNVMEKHGVKRIDPKGELFDPNIHQAIAQLANEEVPDGTILEVAQPGFVLDDRVMRPAMVVVAQGGPKPVRMAEENDPTRQAGEEDGEVEERPDGEVQEQ